MKITEIKVYQVCKLYQSYYLVDNTVDDVFGILYSTFIYTFSYILIPISEDFYKQKLNHTKKYELVS